MEQTITPIEVARTLQAAYNEQYTDAMTEWREIGGKSKAENILNLCKDQHFSKVLECGAGEGSILKHLDASGAFSYLYAIEISDSGIQQIQKRKLSRLKEVRKFNGYEIPYSDNEFDMVYCSHVLEHVEHPRLLLREIKRISRFQIFEIPLDYSVGVDEHVNRFLDYGHINVFTPSTFKFLLRSEGFDIKDELLTRITKEVRRFIWYNNLNLAKTMKRELALHLEPLRNLLRRIRLGKNGYREFGFAAHTCLTTADGELKIF